MNIHYVTFMHYRVHYKIHTSIHMFISKNLPRILLVLKSVLSSSFTFKCKENSYHLSCPSPHWQLLIDRSLSRDTQVILRNKFLWAKIIRVTHLYYKGGSTNQKSNLMNFASTYCSMLVVSKYF